MTYSGYLQATRLPQFTSQITRTVDALKSARQHFGPNAIIGRTWGPEGQLYSVGIDRFANTLFIVWLGEAHSWRSALNCAALDIQRLGSLEERDMYRAVCEDNYDYRSN